MDGESLKRTETSVVTSQAPELSGGVPELGALAAEISRLRAGERAARRYADLCEQRAREATRSKDEMLAILGDELRNPLAAMTLSLAHMKERANGRPDRLCETIERQMDRLTALVNELLDASHLGRCSVSADQQPIEVHALIAAALSDVLPEGAGQAPKMSIELAVPRLGVAVKGDWFLLQQALTQVLANSVKFARSDLPAHIWISAVADHDEALIRIADDGAGVSCDRLGLIFEPFVQGFPPRTRPVRGLGLGLTIVRRVVELHGGTVRAISGGVGCGFEIQIRLPLAPLSSQSLGSHMRETEGEGNVTGSGCRPGPNQRVETIGGAYRADS